jgi:O-methyltransferase domain/Dimerisation domain
MTGSTPHAAGVWRLLELVHGAAVTQVIGTVAELGVVDRVADGPRPVAELAVAVGADPDGLRRLLRAASALGLFEPGAAADTYAVTELGMLLAEAPGSLRDVAIAQITPGLWRPTELLEQAVRTGEPVVQVALGQQLWDYYRDHPEEGALFAKAMTDLSTLLADAVAAAVDLDGRRTIVDVGGGRGTLLTRLLAGAPQARGVVLDRPEVVATAPVVPRLSFVGGDFFAEVPPGDIYLLSHVLHDWHDDRAGEILRVCHRAAQPGAELLVIGWILSEQPAALGPELLDLRMLTHVGGRERTRAHYEQLLAPAGWRVSGVLDLPSGHSVLRAGRIG